MKHIMIDLETFGTSPGCVVWQIGAVVFDDTDIIATFNEYPNIPISVRDGYVVEGATLEWWMNQGLSSLKGIEQKPMIECLRNLSDFVKTYAGTEFRIWANSPSFDLAIIKYCYNNEGLEVFWTYYQERDYRTIVSLIPRDHIPSFNGKKHNALEDAIYQAAVLGFILKNHNLTIH